MDDRLAARMLENNIVLIQKRDADRISLLEKMAVQNSVIVESVTEGLPVKTNNLNYWQQVFYADHFVSATMIEGVVSPGILTWLPANAVIDLLNLVDSKHPGIANVTNDTNGINCFMTLPPLPGMNCFDYQQFIMKFDTPLIMNDVFRIGLLGELVTYQEGVYYQYTYGDMNWQTVTNDGASTINDTGVPFDASKWILLEIRRRALNLFDFYINQKFIITHSTNISTAPSVYPMIFMQNNGTAGAFKYYIDYFAVQFSFIEQAWD